MNIEDILNKKLIPCLTDFSKNQFVFWEAFKKNEEFGDPIKNILELGVYKMLYDLKSLLPGQSTKTLMILSHFFNIDKFISLDIDDCSSTIDVCKEWVKDQGIEVYNHKFVQCNSIEFDIKKEFNKIDFIFLDTNHDDNYPETIGYANAGGAGMTFKEICYYVPYLSHNGRMFLHDTNNFYVEKKIGLNTFGALNLFVQEYPEFTWIEHNTNKHGLGELFRKDSEVAKQYDKC